MQNARYSEVEALFSQPATHVEAAAIAQLKNIFG
jgi:hypothetical protein